MPRKKPERKITRTLRFRLTAAYTLIFTLVLAVAGMLFRQTLKSSLENQAQDVLKGDWAAMKGFVVFHPKYDWDNDPTDPDETLAVNRIRNGIFMIADRQGKPIEFSTDYQELGIDSPAHIQEVMHNRRPEWTTRLYALWRAGPDSCRHRLRREG